MYDPGGVWADVIGWAIALGGVLILTSLVMLVHMLVDMLADRFRAQPRRSATTAPSRHDAPARPAPARHLRRQRMARTVPPRTAPVAEPAPRLDRGREWELVVRYAMRELARGAKVESLQADAAVAIESAEYVYNRLVRDCAGLCDVPEAPASEPAGAPAREPAHGPGAQAEERKPLAA